MTQLNSKAMPTNNYCAFQIGCQNHKIMVISCVSKCDKNEWFQQKSSEYEVGITINIQKD